jgi:ferredoxin
MNRKVKIMAAYKNRFEQNSPGRWYVDNECIDCDLCRETAPETFRRQDEIGYSVVFRQPQTPEELAQAEEARSGCPADAIGNDGASGAVPDLAPAANVPGQTKLPG